jgi:hypothetical protein
VKGSYAKFAKMYHLFEPEAIKMYTIDDLWDYSKGAYARDTQNAYAFIRLGEECTKLWEARGIDFDAHIPTFLSRPMT